MDLKSKIRVALGLEEEIKLQFQAKTEDGTIIVATAEELEAGVDVSVLTEDGTTIKLPAGTYKLDTGVTFRVEEEGIVAEVMESETEEEDEEEVAEEVEASEQNLKHTDEHKYKDIEDRMTKLEEAVEELVKEFGKDKEEMSEELSEDTNEDTNEVSDKPKTIKTTEVVEFSAEDEIKKLKAENEELKTKLSETPADNPINANKFSAEKPAMTKAEYNRLSKREKFLMNLGK